MLWITTSRVAAVSSFVLLAACGGGGGGSSLPAPTPTPAPTVSITQENMDAAAIAGTQAAFGAVSSAGDPGALGVETQTGAASIQARGVALASLSRAMKLVAAYGWDSPLAVGVEQSRTTACNGGGSVTIKVNDANGNNAFDTGESFAITFASCSMDGLISNGSMTVVLKAPYSGVTSNLVADVTMNALSAYGTTGGSLFNGGFSINEMPISDGTSIDASFTNFVMTSLDGNGKATATSTIASSTLKSVAYFNGSGNFTVTELIAGTWGSISGQLTITTPTQVVYGVDGIPSSGVLKVSGNTGSVNVIFTPGVATIRLDTNGDGAFELTHGLLWSQMGVSF